MKCIILAAILALGISHISLANTLPPGQKGDPKKETQTPAFSLSSGYFSLFNFFQEISVTPVVPDTLKTIVPQPKGDNKKVAK